MHKAHYKYYQHKESSLLLCLFVNLVLTSNY